MLLFKVIYSLTVNIYNNVFKSYELIKVCFYTLINYITDNFVNIRLKCHTIALVIHTFNFELNETSTFYETRACVFLKLFESISYFFFLIISDITTILVFNLLLTE